MKYGYARVSTTDQNLQRQLEQLKSICDKVFTDECSGVSLNRKGFVSCLKVLKPGDCLIVTSLDRLSRNYDDIKKIWLSFRDRKIDIKVLDMPLLDTTNQIQGLETRFITDLIIQVLSYVAQKERENIRERQRQGIEIAKKKGKYKGGRPVSLTESVFLYHFDRIKTSEIGVNALCRELNITKQTFYNLKKKYIKEVVCDVVKIS